MTRRIVLFAFFLSFVGCAPEPSDQAPVTTGSTGSDIWLFALQDDGARMVQRVTDREGYDNQPMFSPDGRYLLFSSDRTGHVETWSYDLESGASTQITAPPADKFSPTPIPGTGGSAISVVYDDTLSSNPIKQGLWKFAFDGSNEPGPLADVDMVAYYTWVGTDRVLFLRLSEPNTLQLVNLADSSTEIIEEGLVLSLHKIPGEEASAYFIFQEDGPATIKRFDWNTKTVSDLAPGLHGSKYFGITNSGTLLMVGEGLLFAFAPGEDTDWREVNDLGLAGDSRISVSPDGTLMAVSGSR
jgi:hypothetical protein